MVLWPVSIVFTYDSIKAAASPENLACFFFAEHHVMVLFLVILTFSTRRRRSLSSSLCTSTSSASRISLNTCCWALRLASSSSSSTSSNACSIVFPTNTCSTGWTSTSKSNSYRQDTRKFYHYHFFFRISHLHNSFTDFIIIYLLLIRFTKCNRTTSVMSRDMGVRTDQKNMHAKTAVWEHPYCTSPSSICVAASRPVLAGMKRGVAGLSRNISVWHSTLTSSMWSLSSSRYISKIHISERFHHLISEFITVLSDGKMHVHSEIYTYAHGLVRLCCYRRSLIKKCYTMKVGHGSFGELFATFYCHTQRFNIWLRHVLQWWLKITGEYNWCSLCR